jgi:hypothetical protein
VLSPARLRVIALVTIGALVAGTLAGAVLVLTGEDASPPADPVTVTWGGTEGSPSCLYDPGAETVYVTLVARGEAPEPETLTVTVTAYADENTSDPVGTVTKELPVEGTVRTPVILTIDVDRAPHVDEDGVAACRLSVT